MLYTERQIQACIQAYSFLLQINVTAVNCNFALKKWSSTCVVYS